MTDPAPNQGTTIDELAGLDVGVVDVVLGVATLPLLFWFSLYAVSGAERHIATRSARLRVYLWLLALEAIIVGTIVTWLVTR